MIILIQCSFDFITLQAMNTEDILIFAYDSNNYFKQSNLFEHELVSLLYRKFSTRYTHLTNTLRMMYDS